MAKRDEQKSTVSENYLSLALGVLVVVVIGALIFNYLSGRSGQKSEEATTTEEQTTGGQGEQAEVSLPTTHKVAKGEDLWKISERYYKTGYNWTDIARVNNLANPNMLFVDAELTIPNVPPKVLTQTGEVAQAETTAPTSSDAITGDSYTVAKGDSLWKIAVRAYGDGYKWVDLAKANNLDNPDLIHPGNQLKITR